MRIISCYYRCEQKLKYILGVALKAIYDAIVRHPNTFIYNIKFYRHNKHYIVCTKICIIYIK